MAVRVIVVFVAAERGSIAVKTTTTMRRVAQLRGICANSIDD
jgi:hypothetical protein